MNKRFYSTILCLCLLLSLALPVRAEETDAKIQVQAAELRISTPEEFLAFAESCRLDSFSRNLTVILEADIDLTGYAFTGIPIFSGTFEGCGHRITGLNLCHEGSVQGLFRYLTATALVQDLTLSGTVQPGGSKGQIGAIAGRNAGRIRNCSFTGTLSGSDYVGGIAGVNTVTGIIESCHAAGDIHGDHFVGGIAGENLGVIRSCSNRAAINTSPQQNSIEISDITLDTLTNTEDVNTVTDIGGITGISSGVIRSCRNLADVGYLHMGYNIGGIAGTQTGYITDCENRGAVQGRKEVGGIVGQMEPASIIEYTEDTLQILQGQLDTMSSLVNQASGNAQANAGSISSQIGILQDQAETARDAVDTLFPDADNPGIPDPDTVLAAQNTLSAALDAMPGTLSSIASATQNTLYSLNRDLNAISGQISAMSQTLNNASENLGGTVTDISDNDTPELLTGKVQSCINTGNVSADLNAGGIAGAMALENDLDILEDWQRSGEESLNFHSQVRAVILSCRNRGTVTVKKQNAGGITGWQSLGLVKDCTNTGTLAGTDASYVGGISGLSTGYLRSNSAKCEIAGKTHVGGIAGSGTVVTDSLSQVILLGAKEKQGAILGYAEDPQTDVEQPISDNYYFSVAGDPGAIDGISYTGLAVPLEMDDFMHRENLPDIFKTVTVRFLFEDGTEESVTLRPGSSLPHRRIPVIPEKEGFASTWEGLDENALENVLFDKTFHILHTPYLATVQSRQARENGLPLVLAEGSFTGEAEISLESSVEAPGLTGKDTLLECWNIRVPEGASAIRFRLPTGVAAGSVRLMTCSGGTWEETAFQPDGSYLVFSAGSGNIQLALIQVHSSVAVWLIATIGIAAFLAASLIFLKHTGKKKAK